MVLLTFLKSYINTDKVHIHLLIRQNHLAMQIVLQQTHARLEDFIRSMVRKIHYILQS